MIEPLIQASLIAVAVVVAAMMVWEQVTRNDD